MKPVIVTFEGNARGRNLARRKTASTNWLLIAGIIGFLIVLVSGAVLRGILWPSPRLIAVAGTDPCLPRDVAMVRLNSQAATRTPGNVKVYFDASGGMAGYVMQAPNVIGNLSTLAGNFVQSSLYQAGRPGKLEFRRFGEYRFDAKNPVAPAAVGDPREFARPAVYSEANTNITDLLRWIQADHHPNAKPEERTLSIVVTDLMLDDRQATEDFEASVGGVLRKMVIEDGQAVGIMSVRVPFAGKIFIGNQAFRASLVDRPLVLLLIGDPYQVRAFYEYLETSEIRPFSSGTPASGRGFSLFGLEPGSIVLADANLSGIGTGFSGRPARLRIPGAEKIQSLNFNADAVRPESKGGIEVVLQANAGVQNYEVVGNEPLWEGKIWKLSSKGATSASCKSGEAWARVGSLPSVGWKQTGQTLTYKLDAASMARSGMDQKGVYLLQLIAGQQGIVENHPATSWMIEWSTSNDELAHRLGGSGPMARTGIPGLVHLRNVLLTELRMPGREAIKRTASQLIIQSE